MGSFAHLPNSIVLIFRGVFSAQERGVAWKLTQNTQPNAISPKN